MNGTSTAPARACSRAAYFETIRKARALVKIPEAYIDLQRPLTVTPDEVEEAFVQANPGMTRTGIAVSCDSRRLQEVRICLSKDFKFRDCAEIDRRACRRDKLTMPPLRGGAALPATPAKSGASAVPEVTGPKATP